MTSHPIIVSFELAADELTYGQLLDGFAADIDLLAFTIDYRTPSSQSSPRVSLCFHDTDANKLALARLFGNASWPAYLRDNEPDISEGTPWLP